MNSKPVNQNVLLHVTRHKWQRICLTAIGFGILFCLSVQPAHAADPIFAQQAKLVPSGGQANDYLGNAIAISGNWAIFGVYNKTVGANQQQGAAYVYQRIGSTWTLKQMLTASDGSAEDYFGLNVALSGNLMVIGARYADGSNNRYGMGAAYIFMLAGNNTWIQVQKLIPNDGQAHDNFGTSIAINGLSILIGAPGEYFTDTHTNGAVYVFTWTGSGWEQQQKLTAPDGVPGGSFGVHLASSGSNLAASTIHNPFLNIPKGAVYLFQQSGGWWSYQQKLTSPYPSTHTDYGHDLSMSGMTLAVGGEVLMSGIDESVYVYTLSGSTWELQQKVIAPDNASWSFGVNIALEGNRLVVGCDYDVILSGDSHGSAYVFERSGTTWNLRQKLIAPDGQAEDDFGSGVAISGNTVIVGAPNADILGLQNQGAGYVFTLQTGNTLPTITPYGPHTIQAGSTVHNLPIAALADAETPASSLLFDYDNTPFLTFSNVQKTGGYVNASITCSCGFWTENREAELNVIDGSSAVGVSTITVTKIANTAPSIGRYPVTSIAAGGSKTVYPQIAPSDSGTFTISAAVSPSGFTGNISINPITGAITFSNVGGVGTYTVTVTVTDNCNATTTRTFPLTVQ